jgi:hypothetical protein
MAGERRTSAFAAAATIGSGVLFGLGPALGGSSAASGAVLRRVTGGVVGRTGQGVLRALVAGQVAITVVLLVGAGLFVKSFARLITVEDGLDTSGVVTLRVALTAEYDDPRRVDLLFEELVSRSAALPGVPAARATWALPFTPDWASGRITVEGDPRPHGEELMLGLIAVRGRYFEAIGMRLVEGRVFEPADYTRARAALTGAEAGPAEGIVVIIWRSVVRRFTTQLGDRRPHGARCRPRPRSARCDARWEHPDRGRPGARPARRRRRRVAQPALRHRGFDPASWLAIVLIVTFTGGAACWVPARRASRVPPSIAMRE